MHYSTILSPTHKPINYRRIVHHLSPTAPQTPSVRRLSPLGPAPLSPTEPSFRHVLSSQLCPATPTHSLPTSPLQLDPLSPRFPNPQQKYAMSKATVLNNKGPLSSNHRIRKASENNMLSPREGNSRLVLSNVSGEQANRKSWQFNPRARKQTSSSDLPEGKAPFRKHSNQQTSERSHFGTAEQKWTEISDFKLSDGSSAGDYTRIQNLLLPKLLEKGARKRSDNETVRKVPSFLAQPKKHRSSMGESSPFPKRPSLQNFALLRELGSGAYGRVLLVVEKDLGLVCALKVIPKKVIAEQDMLQQVVRQLKTQSFINHPHVLKIYGYFQDLLHFYIAMEYAMDGQLYEHLSTASKPLQQEQACTLFAQICSAVSSLHSQGIIHRDLKPQNIMLHGGVVKMGDFGWSVHRGMQMRSTFCGTPLYLSPQQLLGEQYDESIDIWAIGVILYQILYNTNPFRITKDTELSNIVHDAAFFDSNIPVSEEAIDLINRCLAKKAKDRPKIREVLLHPFVVRGLQNNQVRK